MSVAAIVETLAKEFSVEVTHAQRVYDLLNAGFKVPTIARFRRAEIGGFVDGTIRRFARRMRQFEELEKRRGTLLKSIEEQRKAQGSAAEDPGEDKDLAAIRACCDRYELEDLFLPHRRPEPEVQLAIDHGLTGLADLLVAPAPKGSKKPTASDQAEATSEDTAPPAVEATPEDPAPAALEPTPDQAAPETASEPSESSEAVEEPAPAEASESTQAEPEQPAEMKAEEASPKKKEQPAPVEAPVHGLHIALTADLARACAPFVNPDRGIHTDEQALDGAVRILSDRLGRSPRLRGSLRRLMRKHGRISVRALVGDKELGRNRSLLKINAGLKQLQGHRLLGLRQAQAQRHVAVNITVDESVVLPKVRAALGGHLRSEFEGVADAIAEQALRQRLLPMIEEEIRTELRERSDEEAIRFLAMHLRQILLTPAAGPRPCAGVHVDAKGDWLIFVVDRDGNPVGEEVRIEAGSQEPPKLAESLGTALRESAVRGLAAGNGKAVRESVQKLRETLELIGADASVFLVNEAGLASYANSEAARNELQAHSVPARQAIGLARRLQDPLQEFLKADVRHLGLGREQSVVSKANLRRVLHDTVESSVAHIGCDLNTAPVSFLRHVPGLNFDLAKKLVERRAERPFSSREELRTEGLLDDLTWTNAIGFLRVSGSSEPLDRTCLHPEQYDLVRRIIHEGGQSVDESLGRRDFARGLKAESFGVDEYTWRDIQREVSFPGRDPRPRQFPPELLPTGTDVKTLEKGRVLEGIVSNVTSFGAFVDIGVPREGMIHISEFSARYVRDARALLSIGQVVRARVVDASGPRVELSLKNVPVKRRHPGGGGKGGPRKPRGGEKGPKEAWPEHQPNQRAARSRRDGLVGGRPEGGGRGGGGRGGGGGGRGGGGRGGGGRGPGRGGPGRGRRNQDEHYDPAAVREASNPKAAYNPFATFFKDKGESEPQAEKTEKAEKQESSE